MNADGLYVSTIDGLPGLRLFFNAIFLPLRIEGNLTEAGTLYNAKYSFIPGMTLLPDSSNVGGRIIFNLDAIHNRERMSMQYPPAGNKLIAIDDFIEFWY